jgi:diguanylate cyclase (GGDEF)-like protein/PAS domain S-box-containing protein
MTLADTPRPAIPVQRLDRLVVVLVSAALAVIWTISALYMVGERGRVLDQTRSQLAVVTSTLADLDELATLVGQSSATGNERRTSAIWRALIQYPAASIWIETGGAITAGQRPAGSLASYLTVDETRANITVHAAIPLSDVYEKWRQATEVEGGILFVVSIAFFLLAIFLSHAMRQRTVAEREAAASEERAKQLAQHRAVLEETVAQRTVELKDANGLLQKELVERRAVEEALREHDGLLEAVAKGATELLGSRSFDDAIPIVLQLIGQTLGIARTQVAVIVPDRDGHLRSTFKHEWAAPGLASTVNNPAFRNLDLTQHLQRLIAPLVAGSAISFSTDDIAAPSRTAFTESGMRSFLQIPIMPSGKLWGSLNFVDSGASKRQWTWAEMDTLETLAGLISVAIARAQYIRELADANTIVQNSPTILFRLRGEPSLPLIYISHNISKFGHDPTALVGTSDWAERLIHPEDRAKVIEAITRVLQKDTQASSIEFRLATSSGSYRWIENRYTPVRDEKTRLVEIEGIMIDITARKEAEDKLALLARTDSLTSLANRTTFNERLQQAFDATKRGAAPFAVLMLDLDHFKTVNDTLGHPAGDQLLQQVAERLKSCTRSEDVIARLGGDEFAILQMEMEEPANASVLAEKVRTALRDSYLIDGTDVQLTVSIGISPYLPHTAGPDTIMAQADTALYRAKEEGRDRYRFHAKGLDEEIHQRMTLAEDLRRAIERDEFFLEYQPQVDLRTGAIIGMEALIRWKHPTRGVLYPADFIATAEKTGVIIPMARWVLDHACEQMRRWEDAGIAPATVAVNVSLRELRTGNDLVSDISSILAKYRLAPQRLELDVTEAILAQITLTKNDVLSQLRKLGVSVAIDDFGTEYSSFSYLRQYHVNHVKLGRSFVAGATADEDSAATIHAIINLARELGIKVIAEGVEARTQLDLAISTGSAEAQGFFFSKPVAADRAFALLSSGKIVPAGQPLAIAAGPKSPAVKDPEQAKPLEEKVP